jgi:uncharacterized short protein YbdD (DUF466 family)
VSAPAVTRALAAATLRAWAWLRAVSGDDAYEAWLRRRPAGEAALTRKQFYLERLQRRYSSLTRCC